MPGIFVGGLPDALCAKYARHMPPQKIAAHQEMVRVQNMPGICQKFEMAPPEQCWVEWHMRGICQMVEWYLLPVKYARHMP